MQVENNSDYKQIKDEQLDSDNSPIKENSNHDVKQQKAQNRIARYEQKPQRKASKMLVRLLQWADKLVMKFFTKKLLPESLQIFFDRQARANKVQLKKAQIDYSVEDFAVRLYVFWVCGNYYDKLVYEANLDKLLHQLCDELIRKKKNLAESLTSCQQQTQRKQKEQELKWMQAIIKGLKDFIDIYLELLTENDILRFLQTVTQNIMVQCLRKPGNKLIKKKEKLQIKIKYFQQKITDILGNKQMTITPSEEIPISKNKIVQKNTIIIQSNNNPFIALTRSVSNSSAFRKYTGQNENVKSEQLIKKQVFQTKFQTPNKFQFYSKEQIHNFFQSFKSPQKQNPQKTQKTDNQINLICEINMEQQILQNNVQ